MKNGPRLTECSPTEYAGALQRLADQIDEPVSFLQAPFYGRWQERDGKTVIYFTAHDGPDIVAAGLAVKYDAPGGISFFYCPYGPVALRWTPELMAALRAFFKSIAARTGVSFTRFDNHPKDIRTVPNYRAITASLQPRAEWLLDISGSQDDIWMGFHKHARYNVRLAERAGAKLELFAPAEAPLDTFFALLQTTSGRDAFSIQSRAYYEAVLQSVPAEAGFVALASIDGEPAAVGLFVAYDGMVHYVFAGSSDNFRKIAPPYFVIWNAILEAKKRGLHTLNFGGISDDVKGTHLAGVTSFKKRFGGYAVTHSNPVDLIYKPHKYLLFAAYKRLHS